MSAPARDEAKKVDNRGAFYRRNIRALEHAIAGSSSPGHYPMTEVFNLYEEDELGGLQPIRYDHAAWEAFARDLLAHWYAIRREYKNKCARRRGGVS